MSSPAPESGRGRWITALVMATFVAGLLAVPPVVSSAISAGSPSLRAADTVEGSALTQINSLRRAHGLRPLRESRALTRAAETHARSMARRGYFGHSSADGTSVGRRIGRFYAGWPVGETILWRSPDVTAAQAVSMWASSSPHRRVLLCASFRRVGLAVVHVTNAPGVYGGRDVTIVVADFGG